MNPPASLFRMASFRLALFVTMFSMAGGIAVFALIQAATFAAAKAEFNPIVTAERTALLATLPPHNESAMAATIAAAIRRAPHTFYALADSRNNLIGGNIAMPPDPLHWQEMTRDGAALLPPGVLGIDGIATRLPGGSETLFIGEDASPFTALNRHITQLFGGIFAFTVLLGLATATVIAWYSLKRVTAITQTSRDIRAGDLSRRIPLFGIDDELDFLTRELNELLAAMQTLVDNTRQVTSDIAHDLRSPMTRLREHLERTRRAAIDPAATLALSDALSRLDEIFGIFDALLRIAEIEAGGPKTRFAPCDISALCESLAETYADVAEDRGQHLSADIEPHLQLTGDAALLTQMLVNMLENAIRHCPPRAALRLRVTLFNGRIMIEMADRGPGIAAPDRERVFARFVRLDAARATPGNGLGLPLIRAVAALHAGTVILRDNRPGLIVEASLPHGRRAPPATLTFDKVAPI